ncbi:fimbrial protein [Dyella mobilis]|uniref:Type 1 fimbrial protein n=1 Tax=Dyella mobilis TaxID=1849582 RepID=A0ABS2KMN6_9GAMM|nr:fimbrial protein [Dyella mobilis]MBM7132205.1 type 1 fimbrial protein [Dyella mobilis]GLQ95809.1 oxidoreductase [Dyella mobilis]
MKGTVQPADTPVPGVTYASGGADYPVYPTGQSSIGYVVQVRDPSDSQFHPLAPPFVQTWPLPGFGNPIALGFEAQILFVAIGPLTPGTYSLPSKTVAYLHAYDGSDVELSVPGSLLFQGATITANSTGCTVTSASDQAIRLSSVSPSNFSGVGSNSGTSSTVNISLNCDAGIAVYATMSDATDPGNTSDVLALTPGSTASGVGIQVYRDGLSTPISFGPDSSSPGNLNQWLVGRNAGAVSYTIPFNASYVQTENTIGPGSVQARSTVTLSYQ